MNKYLRAVSANYIFFFVNTIFFLIITPVAIHTMGEKLYGLWSIVNSILLFSGIGMLGMSVVVNKFASENDNNQLNPSNIISSAIIILLPMSLLVMFSILIARNWITNQFELDGEQVAQARIALVFTAVSIIPQFLGRVPHGYLLSQLQNTLARTLESGIHIATWSGAVIIAALSSNLAWMTLWGMGVQFFFMLLLFALVLPQINFRWKVEIKILRRMLNFSGFTFAESLAVGLFQNFDRLIVGALLGSTIAGVYSLATSVGLRLTIITSQATEVMITYSSRHANNNNKIQLTLRKLVFYISVSVAAMASLLILWMPEILSLWISPQYSTKYVNTFRIVVFCYSFFTLSHPGKQALIGLGKIKTVSAIHLIASILMLSAVYLLSTLYGLTGAAWSNIIMSILIIYVIIAYISSGVKTRELIPDISWGAFFPTLSMVLSITNIDIMAKLLISLLISGVLSIIFIKKIILSSNSIDPHNKKER